MEIGRSRGGKRVQLVRWPRDESPVVGRGKGVVVGYRRGLLCPMPREFIKLVFLRKSVVLKCHTCEKDTIPLRFVVVVGWFGGTAVRMPALILKTKEIIYKRPKIATGDEGIL